MNFDADLIRKAGYKTTTVVAVTNSPDYASVELKAAGEVAGMDELLTVKK